MTFLICNKFVIQSLSCVQLFETLWTAAQKAFLFFTISQTLLKFMYIELVMLFNHLILCHPFLLLPSIFPSIRVFSLHKYTSLNKYMSLKSKLCHKISDWFRYWSVTRWGKVFSIPPLTTGDYHTKHRSTFELVTWDQVFISSPISCAQMVT